MEVLERAVQKDCVLTLQVLSEFFHVVTRKNRMPLPDAAQQVRDLMILFPVVAASRESLSLAMALVQEHSFSFWDALQITTGKEAGVRRLVTEDMENQRSVLGIQLVNPFAGVEI